MGVLGAEGTGGGAGGGTGAGGASTGGGTGSTLGDAGLPCEVATVVSNACASCHGATLTGGAPMSLITRADFMAASSRDATQSNGQRSVARMRDAASPMPTSGLLPVAQVDPFAAWVAAGMPEGTCAPIGPPALTCASGSYLFLGSDTNPPEHMYPGQACISCHQAPSGENPPVWGYMGTVFTAPHEKDLCAPNLTTSATIEILREDGTLVVRLPVNAGGNFMGSAPGVAPATYKARVVTSAGTRTMATAQTNGDCNSCHTAEGTSGAPGRIYLP